LLGCCGIERGGRAQWPMMIVRSSGLIEGKQALMFVQLRSCVSVVDAIL
jgi:hypothetical protein